MKKHTVIIMAGGEKGPLYESTGHPIKALIPIYGKPMLDWVVEAFHKSEWVENIVVVGAEDIEQCASMRFVRKRIFTGINLLQNVVHAVTYVKTRLYKNASEHNGYIFSFCDAVFLTEDIINNTIENIEESGADICLHYVEKESFEKAGLPTKRTYIPIGDSLYTGSVIYYVKKFQLVAALLDTFGEMRKNRKDPKGLLRALECEDLDISGIEKKLSERVSAKLKIFISPHPRLGIDVDKPSDLELAKKILDTPWKHPYKNAAIIYNPKAGRGMQLSPVFLKLFGIKRRKFETFSNKEEYIKKTFDYLTEYGMDVKLCSTDYAGHATEIARECAENDFDLVVAAGGDGTINEVINGLAGSDTVLGIIPMGTANVLALELKIPIEIRAACQAIASGNTMTIDLGRVNDRYFACMAGIGFDAHVLKKADSKLKKILGALAYPVVALSEVLFYSFKRINVMIDEQPIARKGYLVIVGNGKYYAGDMVITTHADMTDGYLDVCIFKHKNIFHVLAYIWGIWFKNIDKHMSVEYYQCKDITILKKGRHAIHIDAEYLCDSPATIKVCPKALQVAV